jgi:hypothetical protein
MSRAFADAAPPFFVIPITQRVATKSRRVKTRPTRAGAQRDAVPRTHNFTYGANDGNADCAQYAQRDDCRCASPQGHRAMQAVAASRIEPAPSTRAAGIAIAAATILSTVFVALDRSAGGKSPLEILQGIAALQGLKELVHGVAIASVCAYAFGYVTLARRLDLRRPLVLAGLVAYLLGCIAMVAAATLDGFVTPHVAVDAIAGSAERIAIAYRFVHYLGVVLTDLAKLGWLLQAMGTLAWSIVLLRERGLQRFVGGIGLVSSALVGAAVLGSDTNMSMASLLGVLLAQLLWNLAAAVALIVRPRGTAADHLAMVAD